MAFAPSFLDGDDLPIYGEKPNDWKPKSFRQASLTGKRIKRGLYRSSNNWCINADCKVAANIITKVNRKLSLDLSQLCRGTLTCPQRVYL
ncbi:hypothetical protein [Okeania sp. KiyG1]|uniref:hypothetical protein n=1 Tax=Okeania sp. KiyG1 TaxID=2720165 RepID=UPI0019212BDB|nr:hypothetical protein [Okeania sp. KiyG1]GFZ95055.1 hypothetical protein CYANOKiyG1_06070 [Okeania sp. KiyG1]